MSQKSRLQVICFSGILHILLVRGEQRAWRPEPSNCFSYPATSMLVLYNNFILVKTYSVLQLCKYVWKLTLLGFTSYLSVDLWKLVFS